MKANKIESLVNGMLTNSIDEIKASIKKAISSGAIDIENWDENINQMITPKIILISVLENEAEQYKGGGTSFEKEIKKEVKNLKLFL